jgi:mono/diheme cytochrome c family protein
LSEARGFVVTPTPEGGGPEEPPAEDTADEGADDGGDVEAVEAADEELTYNEAVGIPTPTYNESVGIPTATPVPQATAAPQPTTPPANQAPTPVPQPTADSSNQAVNVANGGEVYTLNCARCHGANGLGDLGYRGVLGVGAQFGFAGLVEELTNGHPFTFGFGDKLSAQEINDVVAYVTETFG